MVYTAGFKRYNIPVARNPPRRAPHPRMHIKTHPLRFFLAPLLLIALAGVIFIFCARPAHPRIPTSKDGTPDYAAFFKKNTPKTDDLERAQFAYDTLARIPPENFELLFAQSEPLDRALKRQVRACLFQRWADLTPESAWETLQNAPRFDTDAACVLIAAWGFQNFNAAESAIATITNADKKTALTHALLHARADTDPEKVSAFALNSTEKHIQNLLPSLLERWGATDRAAALSWGLAHAPEKLTPLFSAWLCDDYEAASARLKTVPETPREKLVTSLLSDERFINALPEKAWLLFDTFPAPQKEQEKRLRAMTKGMCVRHPSLTFGKIAQIAPAELRADLLARAVKELGYVDGPSAFAFLLAQFPSFNEKQRAKILSETMDELARLAPTETFAFLASTPPDKESDGWKWRAARSLEAREIPAVLDIMDGIAFKDPQERTWAWERMLQRLFRADPAAAHRMLEGRKDRAVFSALSDELVALEFAANPERGMALFDELSKTNMVYLSNKSHMFRDIDFAAAEKVIPWAMENLHDNARFQALNSLFTGLAQKDMDKTMALLDQLPDSSDKAFILARILESPDIDAEAVLPRFLANTPDPEDASRIVGTLLEIRARNNPAEAFEMLSDPAVFELLLPAVKKTSPLDFLNFNDESLRPLIDADADAVEAWITTLPPAQSDRALAAYCSAICWDYPEKAMQFSQTLPEGPVRDQLIEQRILYHWAEYDPPQAMQWLVDAPEFTQTFPYAWDNVMRRWAKSDPVAASEWLADQPAGPLRDRLVGDLAYAEAKYDPESVFNWVPHMEDPKQRYAVALDALKSWKVFNPQEAAEGLENSTLSTEEKAKLKKELGMP